MLGNHKRGCSYHQPRTWKGKFLVLLPPSIPLFSPPHPFTPSSLVNFLREMWMDFSNLPQLQIDQLIKPIFRRLLRNQPFFPFVFHGPKLFRDTLLREKGTPCWNLTPHTNTVLFHVNRDFASTAYLLWMHFAASCFRVRIKWLCAAIHLLFIIFKNAVVGFAQMLSIAVFIGFEDSDGAGRGCVRLTGSVCVARCCSVTLWSHALRLHAGEHR